MRAAWGDADLLLSLGRRSRHTVPFLKRFGRFLRISRFFGFVAHNRYWKKNAPEIRPNKNRAPAAQFKPLVVIKSYPYPLNNVESQGTLLQTPQAAQS